MSLSALPQELRLKIVDHLTDGCESDDHNSKVAMVRNLSTTCRLLNFTCGHIIFHSYHLDIRDSLSRQMYTRHPVGTYIYTWNHSAIKARLAHLQSKAPFVRKIYIADDGDGYQSSAPQDETRPFPPAFIPELLSTLRMLGPLYTVYIITHDRWDLPNVMISTELWSWVVEVSPTVLYVVGHFEFPQGEVLQPIENLDILAPIRCTNATIKALLDSQKPRQIAFAHVSSSDPDPVPTSYYTPTDRNLKSFQIFIDMGWETGSTEVFDFSKIPEATILFTLNLNNLGSKPIGEVWVRVRLLLQQMFVEGLSGYDVHLIMKEGRVYVSRCSEEGWKPERQDHLQNIATLLR